MSIIIVIYGYMDHLNIAYCRSFLMNIHLITSKQLPRCIGNFLCALFDHIGKHITGYYPTLQIIESLKNVICRSKGLMEYHSFYLLGSVLTFILYSIMRVHHETREFCSR